MLRGLWAGSKGSEDTKGRVKMIDKLSKDDFERLEQEYFDMMDNLTSAKFHALNMAILDLIIAIFESVQGMSRFRLFIMGAWGVAWFIFSGDFGLIAFSVGLILGMLSTNNIQEEKSKRKRKNEDCIRPGSIIEKKDIESLIKVIGEAGITAEEAQERLSAPIWVVTGIKKEG
jgi:hypothetical protein